MWEERINLEEFKVNFERESYAPSVKSMSKTSKDQCSICNLVAICFGLELVYESSMMS